DWKGGEPRKVDEGGQEVVTSSRGWLAYDKDGQIWIVPIDQSSKPKQLVVRGNNSDPQWSPDGQNLAFVTRRADHSFIATCTVGAKSIRFMAPSVDSDSHPQWSPDGKGIAFVRRPAQQRDTPQGFFLEPDRPHPWSIWIADAASGSARQIWASGYKPDQSFPGMADGTGGGTLHWPAANRLVIASESDGWQHLYALNPEPDASPQLLTPGNCEVEQWSFTPDGK